MRRFLDDLVRLGELATVRRPVDPRHQLAAITKAVQKSGEQAVLFETVEGTDFPVVSNLYGGHERLCRLVGAGEKTFCQRWIELTDACIAGRDADVLEQAPETVEAALLLSCPPDIFLSACASLPYEASELVMAARISGGRIAMRRCKTIDLDVPASVDIVVEGRFLPNVKRPEGPFGEFMGNYVGVGDNHVFEVTHVSWRPGAVFHALVCGSPEDLRPLEAVTAARVYRHVSAQVPSVIDVCCRPNVMISIIKIRKTYKGQGKHAVLAALGSFLDYNKVVIVVDEDVDIHDLDDVMWAYMTRRRADTRHDPQRHSGFRPRSAQESLGTALHRRNHALWPRGGILAQDHSRRGDRRPARMAGMTGAGGRA